MDDHLDINERIMREQFGPFWYLRFIIRIVAGVAFVVFLSLGMLSYGHDATNALLAALIMLVLAGKM